MIQIFPDGDLVPTLQNIVFNDVYYFLYTNNVTPTDSSVLGDFTIAALGVGPAVVGITVLPGDFSLTGVSGHIGKITANDITFQNLTASPVTVYGYLASFTRTPPDPADVLLAARFDGAPITLAPGDTINVTPTLSLRSAS